MKRYRYLIVGGGMTADAAAHGIRERDSEGSIAILGAEKHPPYNRPPLSKKLWTGKALDYVWRKTGETNADLVLGTRAESGDPAQRTVTTTSGETYGYDKLLLATGGVPRRLPNAPPDVIYFRTLDDYERLRALADRKAEVIVIGGGFIGSEIAAALAMNGARATMVFPDAGIGVRVYPPSLSQFLSGYYREKGVTVLSGEKISKVAAAGGRYAVETESGKRLGAEAVVAGIGIEPELGLARALGLKIDNGIVVDTQLRTSQPDIYAAGDVANFASHALGMRRRVEHEDNANVMGKHAGRNLAGAAETYEYLPYFYSDPFDLGSEAVGEFGTNMDIVEDWVEPNRKGVVYYLRAGRVRGVLLWNTWDKVPAARKLIDGTDPVDRKALVGHIR
jgi:3-phenylpropionate/trans-cinnamate dioxygenase ferredoxin reductase component